ncbi:MAG TPA: redoxin domain-containing protein [Sedimentisphaerales bacterium]|jgi:peroxiredoxin|nr:redoxin domain-containing protein [Sedimentisphaerales bacterium]HNU31266.1 redoxin domain-containing protein [Sedimentisphaerales bacterium]
MNRTVLSLSALGMILALASTGPGQTPTRERTERPRQRSNAATATTPDAAGAQQSTEPRQQHQKLQQQIDELKAAHKAMIAQLQAIQQTAIKEKATETATQVKALIDTRQQAFQKALVDLEQQQSELQRAGRERPERGGVDAARNRRRQAPQFELDSFSRKNIKLSDYKGRIVVLEWINPDCPFSRYHHETAHTMADLAAKYKDQRVVWLAVNSTGVSTVEANRTYAEKHKLPYPILDDRSGQVGRLYGARSTPHMFVIDKNGTIAYEGAIDNAARDKPGAGTINYVDKALSELLAGQKVSMPATPPYGCPIQYSGQ